MVKLLKKLFGGVENVDLEAEQSSSFDAAMAAIDRAAAERLQKTAGQEDNRIVERRSGGPDPRPPGSPERRKRPERRSAGTSFGRRGTD